MSEATTRPAAKVPDASLRQRVAFRPAMPGDVETLVAMINEAYSREAWLIPGPRIDAAALRSDLGQPEARVVIAEIDGELAGSFCVSVRANDAYFGLFAVAPLWQGRGLASVLVAEAERVARDAGRRECARELGLAPFYETLGFTVEREVPGHYYGRDGVRKGPITRVDMVKRLP